VDVMISGQLVMSEAAEEVGNRLGQASLPFEPNAPDGHVVSGCERASSRRRFQVNRSASLATPSVSEAASHVRGDPWLRHGCEIATEHGMSDSALFPFQPDAMAPAELAALSYLAR
jgi:hypothetical protein